MALHPAAAKEVCVKEWDFLFREGEQNLREDEVSIPRKDWNWLRDQALKAEGVSSFISLHHERGRQCLQVRGHVGVVETPGGVRIEILPKIEMPGVKTEDTRNILLKMLAEVKGLKWKPWEKGRLKTFNKRLDEMLMEMFLGEVERLLKKGLRSHYVIRRDDQPFLRGRLRVDKQINRRPGARLDFAIEYQEFLPDRPENRLLHYAVKRVSGWLRDPSNQRRARILQFHLADIPVSNDPVRDLRLWSSDRSLADYRELKPWCEMIINDQSPAAFRGESLGRSFLFEMHQLFEKYVAAVLRRTGLRVSEQGGDHPEYLTMHRGKRLLQLKPDILLHDRDRRICAVLDTKWKKAASESQEESGFKKYKLKESDFYQMAAYGQKYLNGAGHMALVYPRSEEFPAHLEVFKIGSELRLWVLPFDLAADQLDLPPELAESAIFGGDPGVMSVGGMA